MAQALRTQRRHLESSTALWTLSALALAACGGGGGGGDGGTPPDVSNTGKMGETGDKGETGDTGDTGDMGDTGDTGDTSDTGDTGDMGDMGDMGSTVTPPVTIDLAFTATSYSFNLAENDAGNDGTAVQIGTITARDNNNASRADITYALGGTDASSFRIDPNSGAITYIGAALNYEAATKKSFALTVTASAGTGDDVVTTGPQPVTITLQDENDAPVAVSDEPVDFGEIERPDVPPVPTARPTEELDLSGLFMDEDGDSLTLVPVGILPTGISLSGTDLIIAENTSADTYTLTLSASDGKGGVSAQRDITFTITPHVIEDDRDNNDHAGLHGTGYDDHQKGHGGDDILYGGIGADILDGGDGVDQLTGGAGADIFVLDADETSRYFASVDIISDYSSEDFLTFSEAISGKDLWYKKGVNAHLGNGANDTVIYGDKDGTEIIVILSNYVGDISPDDFETPSYVGTIDML